MGVHWWQMPCQWSSACSPKANRAVAELDKAGCGLYLCAGCVPLARAAGHRVRYCSQPKAVAR
jgi:hypothetical protein